MLTKHLKKALLCLILIVSQVQASFVSCHIHGQLGNQLFQTAATLAYAWDNDVEAFFPELHAEGQGIPYNWRQLFFRLNANSPPEPYWYRFQQVASSSSEPIPVQPNLYIDGYFQSWRYFHHRRGKILEVFAPSEVYSVLLSNKYAELLAHPNTVAVHVRTSVRWKHEANLHPWVGFDYYKEAFSKFSKDALFVIFSDRIQWCKKHFPKLCKNVVFIEGNDHIADLYLMSQMKHIIMGTSSFSWWGAYLNKNPKKKVIVPSDWMHPSYVPCHKYIQDYYLPEWTVLPVTFGAYPEDLDGLERSASLDDN